MKKVCTLLISLFLILTGFSQSCLPDGITFSTQAQPSTVIDIRHLPQGLYFVKLTSDRKVKVGKFVKK
jgi:hypothetical protein